MEMPTSLWFTCADQHHDEHGYVCCSTCVTDFMKWSGIPRDKWQRLHTPSVWGAYPEESWLPSLKRSSHLKKMKETFGTKAVTKMRTKRKRDTAKPKAKEPTITVEQSVATQMVSTLSHTGHFLDSLVARASRVQAYQAQQQNDLMQKNDLMQNDLSALVPAAEQLTALTTPIPDNVFGSGSAPAPEMSPAQTVRQNVLGPIAPAVQQNVLGPIVPQHSASALPPGDRLRLAQAMAKLDKLDEWIATALKEVRYVRTVVHDILKR